MTFRKGDDVQVTLCGRTGKGEVAIASENQKSLAIQGEGLPQGAGLMINSRNGLKTLLLIREGDRFIDVASNEYCTLEKL